MANRDAHFPGFEFLVEKREKQSISRRENIEKSRKIIPLIVHCTVPMRLKCWLSQNDPKIHLYIVNLMLITDLVSFFDLVWWFERILWSKWRPPKPLFSDFVSKIEIKISSFAWLRLTKNWCQMKDIYIMSSLYAGIC